jgi:hypothetical protein
MTNITPITKSELKKTITQDGFTVDILVYPADEPKAWILEIEDEFGGSLVWENMFSSPEEAMEVAMQAIENEGIEALVTESPLEPDDLPTQNRFAINITGTQAFVDWINSLEGEDVTLDEINVESTTYMVDVDEEMCRDNMDEFVKGYFETIFEVELAGWYLDESAWPLNRDWALFKRFFNFTISSVVYDLGREPVEIEEF